MTESEGFKIQDRRRFKEEEADAPPISPEGDRAEEPSEPTTQTTGDVTVPSSEATGEPVDAESQPPDEARDGDAAGAGMPSITVPGLLQFTIGTLTELAWQTMGLRISPAAGKVETRLSDARLAIDSLGALLPILSPLLEPRSRGELQTELTNLRLNFVEQTKRNSTDGSAK